VRLWLPRFIAARIVHLPPKKKELNKDEKEEKEAANTLIFF
jgi:hypothetical protein